MSDHTHDAGGARVRSIAPQFLVDHLGRAIQCYRDRFGFDLDFQYQDFYAAVRRGGACIHLKCSPKSSAERTLREVNDHLDAYLVVEQVEALYAEMRARGARVISPLAERPWQCLEYWVMDDDGYILAFSEPSARR